MKRVKEKPAKTDTKWLEKINKVEMVVTLLKGYGLEQNEINVYHDGQPDDDEIINEAFDEHILPTICSHMVKMTDSVDEIMALDKIEFPDPYITAFKQAIADIEANETEELQEKSK